MTRLTEAQRAIVAATDGHLLVEAGAGSGKTTTVVHALCHQLGVASAPAGEPLSPVREPLTMDQVAAVTFTNAAAADLKRKLRQALRDAGRRDLASDVDGARIGTIHGFCGDLLREFALRAGMRPGQRILTEGEATALARECAHDAVREALERGDVPGLDALLHGRKLKDIQEWVTEASNDADRLARWASNGDGMREHETALVLVAQRALAMRRETLQREGALDFDEMLIATRELLRKDEVRHAIQRRLRLLVLDEFQDVDPVQRDIAFLLGGVDREDPAPVQLLLVGDPKQSIYRFRRADVALWNDVRARFSAGAGRVLSLNENFRSTARILGFVDRVIGPDAPTPGDGADIAVAPYDVRYEPLIARGNRASLDTPVELGVLPPAEPRKPAKPGKEPEEGSARPAGAVREAEARWIARRIGELHAQGTRYGDVAMLFSAWGAVDTYADALREHGIPYYRLRSEGFWQAREVLDCRIALRAIRDPNDDLALVGFLKSPFVGVRDDTLLALTREARAGGVAMFSALRRVQRERGLLERGRTILERFGALRDRVGVHDLLERLILESGYAAVAALDPDEGAQRVANLRKLLRLAGEGSDLSVGEFLRDVDARVERKDREANARLHGERADVVTITTVHGAKGLELDVVFWCDTVYEPKPRRDGFLAGRDIVRVKDEEAGGREALDGDASASSMDEGVEGEGKTEPADPDHDALSQQLKAEAEAEARRLWYVAMTRAKQRLIVSGIPLGKPRKAPTAARRLRERLGGLTPEADAVEYHAADKTPYQATVVDVLGVALDVKDGAPPPPAPAAPPDIVLPPTRVVAPIGARRLSASQLMAFAHEPAQWWTQRVLQRDATAEGDTRRARAAAIATGVIVHEVLERLGYDEADVDTLMEDAIATHDDGAPAADTRAGAAYRERIRQRIADAVASPVWQDVSQMPNVRRELPFTRVRGDGSVINGAIDLVARAGESAHIVDVKTTTAEGATLAERYAVQAAVYADAVRAIGGASDVKFALLAVPGGTAVEVATDTDVDALIGRLRGWGASDDTGDRQ